MSSIVGATSFPMMGTQAAGACAYRYDALGGLARIETPTESRLAFWNGGRIVNELRTRSDRSSEEVTWLRTHEAPAAEILGGGAMRTTLLGAALSGSVMLESDAASRTVAYAPHGYRAERSDPDRAVSEMAFNGERLDAGSGCYLLGGGHHRPYSPTLGIFLAPDRESPFARGGLNTLSYCLGDPINHVDPTGHFLGAILAGVGLIVGLVVAVASLGTAIPALVAAGSLAAMKASSVATLVGGITATAGVAVEGAAIATAAAGYETASVVLGAVGLGLGLAGAGPSLAKIAAKGARKIADARRFGGVVRAARRADTARVAREGNLVHSSVGQHPGARFVTEAKTGRITRLDAQDGTGMGGVRRASREQVRQPLREKSDAWTTREELRATEDFRERGYVFDRDVDAHLEAAGTVPRETGTTQLRALEGPPAYEAPPSYLDAVYPKAFDRFMARVRGWR